MGNGYPVAAMVAKPDVLAPFGSHCRYFNTFGGSQVAMAAARAVLEIIARSGCANAPKRPGIICGAGSPLSERTSR